MKENNNDLDFIEEYGKYALAILAVAVLAYIFLNTGPGASIKDKASWGAMGDYFGGMLNPTFALLGLFALLKTIRIQSEELRTSNKALEYSNEELQLTRTEAHLSREALQEQSNSIKLQNFENTFFNMINLHNEIIQGIKFTTVNYIFKSDLNDSIDFEITFKVEENAFANKDLDSICINLKKFLNTYNTLENYMKEINYKNLSNINQANMTNDLYLLFYNVHDQYVGTYFRNIYQILKVISKKGINEKFYSNILRAQLSNHELEFLFYHCASQIGNTEFIILLIKFEFLEHLRYNKEINKQDVKLYMKKASELGYQQNKVFGNNKEWASMIKEFT